MGLLDIGIRMSGMKVPKKVPKKDENNEYRTKKKFIKANIGKRQWRGSTKKHTAKSAGELYGWIMKWSKKR